MFLSRFIRSLDFCTEFSSLRLYSVLGYCTSCLFIKYPTRLKVFALVHILRSLVVFIFISLSLLFGHSYIELIGLWLVTRFLLSAMPGNDANWQMLAATANILSCIQISVLRIFARTFRAWFLVPLIDKYLKRRPWYEGLALFWRRHPEIDRWTFAGHHTDRGVQICLVLLWEQK